MLTEITLEQYLEIKEDIELAIVVFLLGEEIRLIGDSSWLKQTMLEAYAVRLDEEDFKSMDIGVHPKTFLIKDGKEIFEINGIPTEDALGELYES
jgi:hypothetical protein